MRTLPLTAPLLHNSERLQVELRLRAHHINYHEDHLFLLMRQLKQTHFRQIQFLIHGEDVLIRWQSINLLIIVQQRMFIDFHSGSATTHY